MATPVAEILRLLGRRARPRLPGDDLVVPGVHTDHWGTGAVDEDRPALLPRETAVPLGGRRAAPRPADILPPRAVDVSPTFALPEPEREPQTPPFSAPPARPQLVPGEPATSAPVLPAKPVRANTGDALADELDYSRQLGAYRPRNDNNRFKSGLITGLRRFAQGGLPGLVGGFALGLARPQTDEEEHWQGEQARSDSALKRNFGALRAAQDLEEQAADIARKGRTPPTEYDRVETDQGFVYVPKDDPGDASRRVVTGLLPPRRPEAQRNVQTAIRRKADGTEELMQYDPERAKWLPAPTEEGTLTSAPKPPGELVDWKLSDGRTVKISPAAAASADSARQGRTEAGIRRADEIAREDSRRADERAYRRSEQERVLHDEFNREKAMMYAARTERERREHQAKAAAAGAALRDGYGWEFGADRAGNPYVKQRASLPARQNPRTPYAGQRIRRANLPAAARRLGVATIEEAERVLRGGGATIID